MNLKQGDADMKTLFLILGLLILNGCASTNTIATLNDRVTAAETSEHKTAFGHSHTHGSSCGHNSIEVGTRKVFLHDGEKHWPHAGHADVISE